MAIDDHPFDALEKQFSMEELSVSPVTKLLLFLAPFVSWMWPFDKAFGFLKDRLHKDGAHRTKIVLEVCMNEIRKHEKQLNELRSRLSPDQAAEREQEASALLVDATRKAINTRSLDRVHRIGMILANGVVQTTIHPDNVEEMMRVAMELSNREIEYLGELVRIEGETVTTQGRLTRYNAHEKWEHGKWGTKTEPELDSVFSKLASYGLVAPIPPPNNLNIMADFQNRYALLSKGLHFYQLIHSA